VRAPSEACESRACVTRVACVWHACKGPITQVPNYGGTGSTSNFLIPDSLIFGGRSEVVFCFEDDDVEEAAQLMEQRQIRRLPVLNGDKRLLGILSLGDIAVRTQKESLAGEVLERVSEPGARAH